MLKNGHENKYICPNTDGSIAKTTRIHFNNFVWHFWVGQLGPKCSFLHVETAGAMEM
jgi:hypothetical protein